MQRYNFIFIYKLFTSLFYHNHIISPQKPHLSLSNPLFSNILVFVLSLSYLHLIFVHSSSILRSFFVHSSSILRPFFVHSSSILRSFLVHSSSIPRPFFVHSSSILRPFFVHSSSFLSSFLIDRTTYTYSYDSHLPVWLTLFRHYLPPLLGRGSGRGFSFFRLETPFLTFLALLYYIINQLFIHPSYTNRPRFV